MPVVNINFGIVHIFYKLHLHFYNFEWKSRCNRENWLKQCKFWLKLTKRAEVTDAIWVFIQMYNSRAMLPLSLRLWNSNLVYLVHVNLIIIINLFLWQRNFENVLLVISFSEYIWLLFVCTYICQNDEVWLKPRLTPSLNQISDNWYIRLQVSLN